MDNERKERVIQAIYSAVDEINQMLPRGLQLGKSLDSVIIGKTGSLDSLGIVNLIVATESKIAKEFGVIVNLTDERAMSENNSPLETIATLVDYISTLIGEKIDA